MGVNILKAKEISNAKISFVSLVDKAANKKQFLITKANDGTAKFQTYGRILKADPEAHYVTGIVYEPMVEDTQGNFMTEEEIVKAAYGFAKSGNQVDLQHSFEPLECASVVESYVTKCDEVIEGQTIKKGTWVMTVEVTDSEIFNDIQKGDITGFSMGGIGQYSDVDVPLDEPAKADVTKSEQGIFQKVAKMFGFDVVEKGKVKESYLERITSENFWQAFYALQDTLFRWNWYDDQRVYETDTEKIQEALADFNEIVTDLLTTPNVAKSVKGICKAGKKLSNANKETLKGIHTSLGEFLSKFDDEEEEIEVTKSEMQEIVKSAVAEYLGKAPTSAALDTTDSITKEDIQEIVKQAISGSREPQSAPAAEEKITKSDVQKMIDDAIRKATGEEDPDQMEPAGTDMEGAIAKAVATAMEPFMLQAGLPTNLNNSTVQKSDEETHYMHGFI